MLSPLTPAQLQRLKEHKYNAQGTSLTEPVMQVFWRWLVTKIPLWVAPNLITFVGLLLNVLTTAPVIAMDYNANGTAPKWVYFTSALGFFMYQSLDAIDGKQARRTGTSTPLGELFDHGCDAFTTYLVVVSGISAIGISCYPYFMLSFVELLLMLTFSYHWQTYVCGVLHFKLIDVTEAQFGHIAVLMVTVIFGVDVWTKDFPILGISNKVLVAMIFTVLSVLNLVQAFHIILTGGVGKNGTTVADTSVLSPILTPLVLVPLAFLSAYFSPSHALQTNAMLFIAAFSLPLVKLVIVMQVATLTKSPYPLFDSIMLGPLVAFLNVYFGPFIPEIYLLVGVAVYNIMNVLVLCTTLSLQISKYLNAPLFTLTQPPKEPLSQ